MKRDADSGLDKSKQRATVATANGRQSTMRMRFRYITNVA